MSIPKCTQVELLPLGPRTPVSTESNNPRRRTVPKMQLQVPAMQNKHKCQGHRTTDGNLCCGSIQIIGLCYSLCSACREWIPTNKMMDKG